MKHVLRRSRRQAGQSLVEFAISGSLLILMLLGMVQFSIAYTTQVKLRQAVSEASYYAMMNPVGNENTFRADISNYLRGQIARQGLSTDSAVLTILITPGCRMDNASKVTEISVQYVYSFWTIFPNIPLQSSTQVPQLGSC